jgi:hypothetical protein
VIPADEARKWFDLARMAGCIETPASGEIRVTKGGLMVSAAVLATISSNLAPGCSLRKSFDTVMVALQAGALAYNSPKA